MAQGKSKAPRLQVVVGDAEHEETMQVAPAPVEEPQGIEEPMQEAPQVEARVEPDETATSATEQDEAADGAANPEPASPKAAKVAASVVSWPSRFFPGHEHAAWGGLCGIVIAILVFVVGFWKTLFVTVMACVGITLGQCLDGDPKIINFIRRMIDELRGE